MAGWASVTEDEGGVGNCLTQIRMMVLAGELLPGQKVHQGDLAQRLGVSRIPVREALAKLHAEGVLDHRPKTGFTVARFNSEDLAEIYLMRRLLETALTRATDLSTVDVKRMRELLDRLSGVSPVTEPEEFAQLNKAFHFTLFEASPLELVRQEVERLWYMSSFYRALHLYEAKRSANLQAEHLRIIEAIEQNDLDRLILELDQHRASTEHMVVDRIGRSRRPSMGAV
ncbi:GntR family transcriptional regulator [Pseudonocardia lutea]|uniref:GntR family transcriptional regulator n=1 Tax=Pseudonocardia lutea TaxID=2172015 RepID=A0ABW1I4D7_9PSEU